ncbi:hypothetical protein QBC46DRAFT_452115 [Diplogelasinospora grovesii]|uniref:Uncharacterized protein n=1 Tax=Diplogelasinospora grovesii TaxID=303347 RepID=A0AAN6N2V2_9PEZI|nr:hypothetical protein QBC46DRAFT_452115 [Diplogelasinospora grovesii]
MSWVGTNASLLGRCSNCLLRSSLGLPAVRLMRQPLRHATTAAKPRAKKTNLPSDDPASVPKKSLSTRSSVSTTAAKSPRKKTGDASAAEVIATEAPVAKKTTRAASTKSTATAAKTAASSAKASTTTRVKKSTASTSTAKAQPSTPATESGARFAAPPSVSTPAPAPASAPATVRSATPVRPTVLPEAPHAETPKITDPSSPEYKKAERKYTSLMVALPILLVTSYYLFDRLALGHAPKELDAFRKNPDPEAKTSET